MNNAVFIRSVPVNAHAQADQFSMDVDTLSNMIVELISTEVGQQYHEVSGRNDGLFFAHEKRLVSASEQGFAKSLSDLGHGINPTELSVEVKVSVVPDSASIGGCATTASIKAFYGNLILFHIDGRHVVVEQPDSSITGSPKVVIHTYYASWNTLAMLFDHLTTKILTLAAGKAMLSLVNLSINSCKDKGGYVWKDSLGVTFTPLPSCLVKQPVRSSSFPGGFTVRLQTYNAHRVFVPCKPSVATSFITHVTGDTVMFSGITHSNISNRNPVDIMRRKRTIMFQVRNPITAVVTDSLTVSGN